MRPGMPDVVLRHGASSVTFGPAFVSVGDGSTAPRSFPRDPGRGVRGAVARLRAEVAAGPPGLRPPEIRRLSLVDGQGVPLAALAWSGDDHDGLEAACAAARVPLDRVPPDPLPDTGTTGAGDAVDAGGASGGGGREVLLRPPRAATGIALRLGPREVAVTGVDGQPLRWPRLGCAAADDPAASRLRVTLYAEEPANDPDLLPGPPTAGPHRLLGLTVLAPGGRALAYLRWHSRDLAAVRRAAAATGLLLEYRWQPYGDGAELARQGVPVVHATEPSATAQVTRGGPATATPARPAAATRPRRAGRPTARPARRADARSGGAARSGGTGGLPARTRWLLYAVALLALAGLAAAAVVLSSR